MPLFHGVSRKVDSAPSDANAVRWWWHIAGTGTDNQQAVDGDLRPDPRPGAGWAQPVAVMPLGIRWFGCVAG